MRATVYGAFRVPLNLIVVTVELIAPTLTAGFGACTGLLVLALVCFAWAHSLIKRCSAGGGAPVGEATPLVSEKASLQQKH